MLHCTRKRANYKVRARLEAPLFAATKLCALFLLSRASPWLLILMRADMLMRVVYSSAFIQRYFKVRRGDIEQREQERERERERERGCASMGE